MIYPRIGWKGSGCHVLPLTSFNTNRGFDVKRQQRVAPVNTRAAVRALVAAPLLCRAAMGRLQAFLVLLAVLVASEVAHQAAAQGENEPRALSMAPSRGLQGRPTHSCPLCTTMQAKMDQEARQEAAAASLPQLLTARCVPSKSQRLLLLLHTDTMRSLQTMSFMQICLERRDVHEEGACSAF